MNFASRLFFQMPQLEDFFRVLDARTSVPEKPDAATLRIERGEVTFEDVSFAYPGGPKILDGVSFTAASGTAVALVGHTGAGKSTAMNLLPIGQALWLKELETYVKFPPLQDPASYNLDQVMEELKKAPVHPSQ